MPEPLPSLSPAAFCRWGWYPHERVLPLFDHRMELKRWRDAMQPDEHGPFFREKSDGSGLEYRGDAVLPDGRALCVALQDEPALSLPAPVARGTATQRNFQLAAIEARRLDLAFQKSWKGGATTPAYFAALCASAAPAGGTVGAWLAAQNLPAGRNQFMELRRRVDAGEPISRKAGRCGRKALAQDERLVEAVREIILHPNKFTEQDAFEHQQDRAAELGIEALTRHQVRAIVRAIPSSAKVWIREGERQWAAKCEPKMRIDYSELAAGDWSCGDGRLADVYVRVPDACGVWKVIRPAVTAWIDTAARKWLGWDVRETENAEGILAGLAMALRQYGAPRHVTYDNGKAYKRAAGSLRGTQWQRVRYDDKRLGSVFAQLSVQAHVTLPYRGWAKIIESHWRSLKKRCDRWALSFAGGTPAERSETALDLLKHDPAGLPTLDEFREWLRLAIETHNATPLRVLGGLSPDLYFEQRRGTVRRVADAVIEHVCAPVDGPYKVGREGVMYRRLRYAPAVEQLVKLQGKSVYVRPDIQAAGRVVLCDAELRPICVAEQERLIAAGATGEDFRAAMRRKSSAKRIAREYAPARDFLLQTTTGQILRTKRDRAVAEQNAARKALPVLEPAAVSIVRPDLAASVQAELRSLRGVVRTGPVHGAAALAALHGTDRDAEAAVRGEPKRGGNASVLAMLAERAAAENCEEPDASQAAHRALLNRLADARIADAG